MKYPVTITETLKKKVFVEAQSKEEAEYLAECGYGREKYVLTADDFATVRFRASKSLKEIKGS